MPPPGHGAPPQRPAGPRPPAAGAAAARPGAWPRPGDEHRGDQRPAPGPAAGTLQAEEALRADMERLGHKYRFMEPNAGSARYQGNARLPHGPNHERYSRWEAVQPQGWEVPVKFEVRTLERWFKLIDVEGRGTISGKEMVMGLRRSRELRHVMRQMQGMRKVYSSIARPGPAHAGEPRAAGRPGCEASEAHGLKEARRHELRQLQGISGGGGKDSRKMDLGAFVDFFREAGLLLEHDTGRNVTRAAEGDLLRDLVRGCLLGAEAPSGFDLQRPSSTESELTASLSREECRASAPESTAAPPSRLGLREDSPSELSDGSPRRRPSLPGVAERGAAPGPSRAAGRPRSAAERPRAPHGRLGGAGAPQGPGSARAASRAACAGAGGRGTEGAAIMAHAALALARIDVKRGLPA